MHLGAVLSHRMPDGSEKPIGFMSRTLMKAEQNYSQVEKEGLACVYGVKHFHSYLFGHKFVLHTRSHCSVSLFKHQTVSNTGHYYWHLMSILLFRSTSKHANADAMSRLPLPEKPASTPVPAELALLIEKLDEAPITSVQIARRTLS